MSFTNGFSQTKSQVYDQPFSEDALLKNLENLSSDAFEGRRTGTRGGIKARKYIINEFHKFDIHPLLKTFEQPFSFTEDDVYYEGANVLGLIKGTKFPNKYIVVSAHYDHEGIKNGVIYNGADDNASGVSALFSFAEYLKNHPPQYSVILAAFDAEELGLQGSKYFVEHSKVGMNQIVFNINMDMISRSDKNELYAVGTGHFKFLKPIIFSIKSKEGFKLKTGHDEGNWRDDWTHASDHGSFFKKGIPFLYFGVEDHEDYHEPTDDYENIQPDFYGNTVKAILSVFEKLDKVKF
ncbi:M28 family peptidase [Aestuariibaculum suncheonense]|uniref:M28 family peptidase n=1 Tax=Aestuariibaculum suncheonense TaxID=1028745 RepID=UPI001F50EE33|nr:M28 family peptidase [Aestuariibaculum suncheonense]